MATPGNPHLPSIGPEANVAALHLTIELSTGVKARLRYGEIMGLRRKDFALRDRKVKIDRAYIQRPIPARNLTATPKPTADAP